MTSNDINAINNVLPAGKSGNRVQWIELVKEQVKNEGLMGMTCAAYSSKRIDNIVEKTQCVCGRHVREHSYTGTPKTELANAEQWVDEHADLVPVTVFGQLTNGAQFIRCSTENNAFQKLISMIVKNVGSEPRLIVSCYGGAEYFTMKDSLEREFMNGIGQVAATKNVWILTTGLNSGVSMLIGQGVHRRKALHDNTWDPVVIGMSSWGSIAECTRVILKEQSPGFTKSSELLESDQYRYASFKALNDLPIEPSAKTVWDNEDTKTLDKNHTHFLLLDDGRLGQYLSDKPRSTFVKTACAIPGCHAVTIIVEGGANTLEVIQHDIQAKRPVVIVHGSGRLANVLGNLLKKAGKENSIERDEVIHQLQLCKKLWPASKEEQDALVGSIGKILDINKRRYLSIFQLGQDADLIHTLFQAIHKVSHLDIKVWLKLAVHWNCMDAAHTLLKREEEPRIYYPSLFSQALRENRPVFVDYFLRRYYNPLEKTIFIYSKEQPKETKSKERSSNKYDEDKEWCIHYALHFIIHKLHNFTLASTGSKKSLGCLEDLDRSYSKWIGPFVESFYFEQSSCERLWRDISSLYACSKWTTCCSNQVSNTSGTTTQQTLDTESAIDVHMAKTFRPVKNFEQQAMFRDIFFWSVIGAALIAARMAQHLSLTGNNPYTRNTYGEHRVIYEEYARACIDACYQRDKQRACQLLLREIPLYGNMTCAQVAIASEITPVISTHCFNQILDRQWYGYLDAASLTTVWAVVKFTIHLASLGLLAPRFLHYRSADTRKYKNDQDNNEQDTHSNRNFVGIDDQIKQKFSYGRRLLQFHSSPVVMISYQFLIYIWFLLVFSYWMLFHMQTPNESIGWSEIYLIIAISATLIEDIRKFAVEYRTQMLERWRLSDIWLLIIYPMPYILFYVGFGLHVNSTGNPDKFTAARIILAIDLEIWYFLSLRFVSAVKLLGPKLFMIRNMLRDLFGIMYIIFVCIAAYGVASRALVFYSNLEFTPDSIAANIFYPPYWFLYQFVDDKTNLDTIISSNSSTANEIVEAKVAHVLLAFQMLIINILILSLLIAVFNFSINAVQEKNEYFWRYQRYELICEYFEKPMFAYPPLSLVVYVWLLIGLIYRRHTRFRVLKYLYTPSLDAMWTDFEDAATYDHARDLVEKNYRWHSKSETAPPPKPLNEISAPQTQMGSSDKTVAQIDALNEKTRQLQNAFNEKTAEMQGAIAKLEAQTQQVSSNHGSRFQILSHISLSLSLSLTDYDWNGLDDEGYRAR
ncbi:unnamed protein product [Rotaria magnacalcarata]|uniref:TRPM SLOG domain-containing protein n=1 Tax=Rotaria magnacalcarata TaxID=392030 RepID=A0A818W6P9_9BILA|nr:unnamed protein product [Rotaria magnacalcarata]CAF3964380.1 unnamed protein product [Rotaria magnacalcarata]